MTMWFPINSRQRGFTLIEILVSLLIMGVLSVLAYSAFDGILALERRSKADFLQHNRFSLASSILLNDLLHLRARPVRDTLGGIEGAYVAPSGDHALEFTRGGLPDFDFMRGGIQRVAYRVENQRLIRSVQAVADRGPATESHDQVLAADVAAIAVEQLDAGGAFIPFWPPAGRTVSPEALPALVRITLTTVSGDSVSLLVPGPDGYPPATGAAGNE